MPLTLRLEKGSELTYSELDGNFTYLSSSLNSLIATGSVSSNVLTFTKGDGSTFNLTVNTGSGGGGGGGTTLVQDLTSNQTVGGVSPGDLFAAGSTIEALLRSMLITYIEPVIGSLLIKLDSTTRSTATRDVGNSFTCNSASFSATVDSPDGNYPVTASITASGADIGTTQVFFSNTLTGTNAYGLGSTLTINKASTAGNVTFTVNTKSQTTIDTQSTSTSFAFYWRNYLAASSTPITDDASAQAVIDSDTVTSTLTTTKAWTATCDDSNDTVDNYTYIIYPATYGDLSNIIQDGALSVLTAFDKLGDFTVANAYASSTSFRVYKSKQDKAFGSGVTLTIS